MSSKKGQSKKIDSARRAPSRRGLAGYSAPRRKTPEGRYVFTLYGRRHAARQKTPEGRYIFTLYGRGHAARRKTPKCKPLSALYNTDTVHSPRRKTPEGRHIFTLYKRRRRSHTAAENAERQASLRILQHRHRSHAAAETSDSGYNSTLCKHHPYTTEKAAYDSMAAPTPKELTPPLDYAKKHGCFYRVFLLHISRVRSRIALLSA